MYNLNRHQVYLFTGSVLLGQGGVCILHGNAHQRKHRKWTSAYFSLPTSTNEPVVLTEAGVGDTKPSIDLSPFCCIGVPLSCS